MRIATEQVLAIDVADATVRGMVLAPGAPPTAGGYAQLGFDADESVAEFAVRIATALDVQKRLAVAVSCDASLGDDLADSVVQALTAEEFSSVTSVVRSDAVQLTNPTGGEIDELDGVAIPAGLLTSQPGLRVVDLAAVAGSGLSLLDGHVQAAPIGAEVEPVDDEPAPEIPDPEIAEPVEPVVSESDPFTSAPTSVAGAVSAAAAMPVFGPDDDLTIAAPAGRMTMPTPPTDVAEATAEPADAAIAAAETVAAGEEVDSEDVTVAAGEEVDSEDLTSARRDVLAAVDELADGDLTIAAPAGLAAMSALADQDVTVNPEGFVEEDVTVNPAGFVEEDVTVNPDGFVDGDDLTVDPEGFVDQDLTVNPDKFVDGDEVTTAAPIAMVQPAIETPATIPAAQPPLEMADDLPRAETPAPPAADPLAAASFGAPGDVDQMVGPTSRPKGPLLLMLALLAAVAVIALALTQCGGSDDPSTVEQAIVDPPEEETAVAAAPTAAPLPTLVPEPATAEPTVEPAAAEQSSVEAEPTAELSPEPTADPLEGLPPLSTLPERGAVFRPPTLFLEGPVPTQAEADAIFARAAEVVGPDNVQDNLIVRPDAPTSNDGNVRIEQAVLFQSGSAVIAEVFVPILDLGVLVMTLNPQVTMIVQGHTDTVGSADGNQRLSQRRAQAVVDYLTSQGIDESRLEAVGLGQAEPVADNDTAEGRQINRRIEVELLDLLVDE